MINLEELLRKVQKELEAIGEKGLSMSNLETTYKLIDIYKDIKEACYYETKTEKQEKKEKASYFSESDEKCMSRLMEGMKMYREGREEFNEGKGNNKMIEGLDIMMSSLTAFITALMNQIAISAEKEVIRRHINVLREL